MLVFSNLVRFQKCPADLFARLTQWGVTERPARKPRRRPQTLGDRPARSRPHPDRNETPFIKTGLAVERFWDGLGAIIRGFAPRNRKLLDVRDMLQARVDDFHRARRGRPFDLAEYESFLRDIEYLAPEPPDFSIRTANVDDEIAHIAGPQLVVPLSNARYALNAANARWGSLYDALYGTDAIPEDGGATHGSGYNKVRGVRVIARAREILDTACPAFAGQPQASDRLRDRKRATNDPAGIADVVLGACNHDHHLDLEDSVAAVDADDKVEITRNWLELTKGTLTASFDKAGRMIDRPAQPLHRPYQNPPGGDLPLPGRSLMLIRNVGHHMYTDAVRIDAHDVPEGIVDAAVTSLIAVQDLRGLHPLRNSRTGSIYIVKPKMHGPAEVAFTDELFARVEDLLLLPREGFSNMHHLMGLVPPDQIALPLEGLSAFGGGREDCKIKQGCHAWAAVGVKTLAPDLRDKV